MTQVITISNIYTYKQRLAKTILVVANTSILETIKDIVANILVLTMTRVVASGGPRLVKMEEPN
jgi:hypothetical protein